MFLVADVQQEKTLETLLPERAQSLGIGAITFDIFRHPRKDSGVYHQATDFLFAYRPLQYRYAYYEIGSIPKIADNSE